MNLIWKGLSSLVISTRWYLFATIKNIMANFIPHETIICDDRDPPWINNRTKILIYKRNSLYKDYCKNNDTQIFEKLMLLQRKLHLAMGESKDTYYSNLSTKLAEQRSNPKTYLSVRRFLNNKKNTMHPITIS